MEQMHGRVLNISILTPLEDSESYWSYTTDFRRKHLNSWSKGANGRLSIFKRCGALDHLSDR